VISARAGKGVRQSLEQKVGLSVWSPDERAYLKALFATEDVA